MWSGVKIMDGMTVTGSAHLQTAVSTSSDERLKENIEELSPGSLDSVMSLRGVYFTWKDSPKRSLSDPIKARHVGVIAQDVARVLKEAVYESNDRLDRNDSLMHVSYDKLIPLLVKAIQELDQMIQNMTLSSQVRQRMDLSIDETIDSIDSMNTDSKKESIFAGTSQDELSNESNQPRDGLLSTNTTPCEEKSKDFQIEEYEKRLERLLRVNKDIMRRVEDYQRNQLRHK